jgi:hypothetical protein
MKKFIKVLIFALSIFLIEKQVIGQTNVSGVISTNTTWTKINSPYIVTNSIIVSNGILLTIEPGVSIKFNLGKSLQVDGTIFARGTLQDSIYFTSNANSPTNGDWSNISFTNNSVSATFDINSNYVGGNILEYCKIEYAGSNSSDAININGSGLVIAPFINNCKIINNKAAGIYISYGSPKISNCTIEANNSGISIQRDNSNPSILNNFISKNINGGIELGVVIGGALIKNNILIENGSGITGYIWSYDSPISIQENKILLNKNAGINFSTIRGSVEIIKNIIADNIGPGISFNGWSAMNPNLTSNQFIGNGASSNNAFYQKFGSDANEARYGGGIFKKNLFAKNLSKKNVIFIDGSQSTFFDSCNFSSNNSQFLLYNNNISGSTITSKNNWWESNKDSLIQTRIYDFNDDASKGVIDYLPYRNSLNINAPISPTLNVVKKISGNSVVVSWVPNLESNVSGYKIYYKNFTGYSFQNVIDVGNITSYTLPANISINDTIAVTSYNSNYSGTNNQINGFESWYSIANAPPNNISNLTANSASHKIKLGWAASLSLGVNNYKIYRSTDGTNFNFLNSTIINSYTDTGLVAYTKFYYRVASFDSLDVSYNNYGLESSQSEIISAIPTNRSYVDSIIGSDLNGIGSIEKPYAKVSTAVANSVSGDSVLIGKGTYLDNINLTNKVVNFIGINGTGNVLIKPLLQGVSIINISNGGNSTFKGISFANVTSNNAGAAVYFTKSSPSFESCVFRNNAGTLGVIASDAGTFTMNNCIAYANTSNQFFNITTSVSSPAIINHFTYSNNNGSFLSSSLIGNLINIKNSILWNTTNLPYTGTINIQNSIVKGGFSGNTSNLNFSPVFVDSVKNDFHLASYSPAIALGLINTGVTQDYEGNSRSLPLGSLPDAGAFESLFGQSAPYIDSTSSQDGILTFNWTQRQLAATDSFTIYKDTSSLSTVIYKTIGKSVSFLKDSSNNLFNTPFYFRMTSKSVSGFNSGFSNIFKSIVYTPSKLLIPNDKTTKTDTSIRFTWSKVPNATIYRIQIANDSLFSSLFKTQTLTDTTLLVSALAYNKTYYWRIRTEDSIRNSRWADFYTLQTKVPVPKISSISTSNGKIDIQYLLSSTINIKKINIYRDTAILPIILKDTSIVSKLTFSDSVVNQIKYYYRITSVNLQNVESDFSNIVSGVGLISPSLDSPINNVTKTNLLPTFAWRSNVFATKYQLQIDTSSLFSSTLKRDSIITSNKLIFIKPLLSNNNYYWRVRSGDINGWSDWCNSFKFQTLILPVQLLNIAAGNKRDTLKWVKTTDGLIKSYRIYRDTIPVPVKILDSVSGNSLTYIDTSSLSLNTKYYYSIRSINYDDVESLNSNIQSVIPFNNKPFPAPLLSKIFENAGEYNTVRVFYSASGSKDTDGYIVGYKWYVNDSLVNQSDSILIYYYKQGLNDIRLEITDNDGATSISNAQVKMSAFVKKFAGGILGGITALNDGTLYTADSTYDVAKGASVYKINRAGNTVYPLIVSSKIFTTPSISSDSSVFITSGSSLNGFNASGAPLWSTIPLGGLSLVTPTIDSVQKRLYVGVSNANFFAIDYSTGKVIWNVICDAPINSSAIITADRNLVFASDNGTLYGFDLRSINGQPTAKWKYTFQEKISKSPAVDSLNNLYFGSISGKLMKLKLDTNGIVRIIWSKLLDTSSIQSSPIIDAKGFIYAGTSKGRLYKLNPDNGNVIWFYSSKGAIISTPTVSDYGNIYVADKLGYITSLSEEGIVNWKYQDSSAISSNLLWLNNMTYVGTEGGRLIGFYDNPNSNTVNTSLSYNFNKSINHFRYGSLANVNITYKLNNISNLLDALYLLPPPVTETRIPVWGTFQGNYRRTGSKKFECPETPVIQIPNCVSTSDSIRISTSNMTNRYWILNDTKLTNVTESSILVKSTDKFKLVSYNSVGCEVFSGEPTLVPNSNIAKPNVVTSNGTGKICEGDSIILTSSIDAAKYQWNYAGAPISTQKSKNLKTSLAGAYSLTVINNYGCVSSSDLQLVIVSNPPAKPTIIASGSTSFCTGGSVILNSSANSGNQWYKDGQIINNATLASYTAVSTGKYSVRVTNNGNCTVTSDEMQVSGDVSTSLTIPVISGIYSDTSICFRDSIVLKTDTYYDKYLWSNGDTTSTTIIRNSAKVSLRGVSNGSTCYSLPSKATSFIRNLNITPEISSLTNSIVATNSNNYKWFRNNLIVPGVTANVLFNPSVGVYRVETSLDKYCWDASKDYAVLLSNSPILNDTVILTTYPNPSTGSFNISATFQRTTNVITKIIITDISGNVVYQSQKLLFFSNKILIPINLGNLKGSFVVNMDINGSIKTVIVFVN